MKRRSWTVKGLLGSLALLLVGSPVSGDAPPYYAIVEGRVTNLQRKGVADAAILLQSPEADIRRWPGSVGSIEGMVYAKTDAQGHYRIAEIPPGRWYVAAIADGYALGEYGMQTEWRERFQLELVAGEHLKDIDLVLPWSCELTGVCCDATGKPLPDAMVSIGFHSATDGQNRGLKIEHTDEAGRWTTGPCPSEGPLMVKLSARGPGRHRFEDREVGPLKPGISLDTGTWRALVVPPATASLHGVVERRDGGRLTKAIVRVRDRMVPVAEDGSFRFDDLVPGEVVPRVSPEAHPCPSTPGPLVKLVADKDTGPIRMVIEPPTILAGRVLDERGEPYPDAHVAAFPAEGPGLREGEFPWGTSDANGAFRMAEVPPGEYVVTVDHVSHERHREDPWEGASARVAAGTEDITLRLPRPYTVRYRAQLPAGLDACPDFSSFPVRAFGGTLGGLDEAWQFREVGRLEIQIHLDARARWIGVLEAPARGATYDLGRIAFPEPSRIAGVVVDPDGRPVQYPKVHAIHLETGVLVDDYTDRMFGDQSGRFSIERLPAGGYAVFAITPGQALALQPRVEVGAQDTAQVRLVCGMPDPLELRVTGPDGSPVERARVKYRLDSFPYWFEQDYRDFHPPSHGADWTDADGRLGRPLMVRGALELRVRAEGFAESTLRIEAGDSRRVHVVLGH